MGYNTTFKGQLAFTGCLTNHELAYLNTILGSDCREHPEWGHPELTYVDFELTPDFKGIQWDGSEKSYDSVAKVNLIIQLMRANMDPNFGLKGMLTAQGENVEDRWLLVVENNKASAVKLTITGKIVTCPHCNERFILEE